MTSRKASPLTWASTRKMFRKFSLYEIRILKSAFLNARPFRHVLVTNFLASPDSALKALARQKFFRKDSDLFSFSQTQNLLHSTPKELRQLVAMFSSPEFSGFVSAITGKKLRSGSLDLSGAVYNDSDYLLCHDDDLEGRKIAFILYLSPSFKPGDGGELVFYSSRKNHPHQKAASYPPVKNSLMVFEVSKKSWHEIEEVKAKKKRYTIGGWLH